LAGVGNGDGRSQLVTGHKDFITSAAATPYVINKGYLVYVYVSSAVVIEIANKLIFKQLGADIWFTELPVTPEKIVKALRQKEQQ